MALGWLNDVSIVLNTRGRVDRQHTLADLHPTVRRYVDVVCRPTEGIALINNWYGNVKYITEHPYELRNLTEVRDWCIKTFPGKYIIFMDDNLVFQSRTKPDIGPGCKYGLHRMTSQHYNLNTIRIMQYAMLHWIVVKLREGYGVAGISQRPGNQNRQPIEENTRFYAFYGVSKPLFHKVASDWLKYPIKQDMYLGLKFLTNGIKTVVNCHYAFDKAGGTNAKGGVSEYRTNKLFNQVAVQLKDDFPAFVALRKKSTKSWKGGWDDTTMDVRIRWQKAYKYGIQKYKSLL